MRTRIIIAVMATAIALSSCDWFSKKKDNAAFNIQGNWKLDSLTASHDTTSLAPLLIAWAALDSNQEYSLKMHFTKDSMFATYATGEIDTVLYKIDTATQQLSFAKDTATEVLTYKPISDSTLSIAFKDSTTLYLSKQ